MPSLKAGGAQRVIINIINKLVEEKYKVLLVLICYKGDLFDTLPNNLDLKLLNKNRVRDGIFECYKILREYKPDLVFSSLAHVNLILLFLSKFLPTHIKFIVREANTPSIIIKNRILKILYRYLYNSADKIIAQSELIKNELIELFHIKKNIIARINNPVDIKLIRKNINRLNRLDENKKFLISAGRLVHQKGLDILINILSKFDDDFYLIILGEGPDYKHLTEIVKNLNIEKKIFFYGYVKNPWELIASADIFLLPSRWEGTPNAALEALACGTKIIASPNSGGLIDLKESVKKNDIIITNFDDNFIYKLRENTKLLKNEILSSKLPKEYYSENVTSTYINLFREIVE